MSEQKKQMEYYVIEADSIQELLEQMATFIGHGWKPLGGVSAHSWAVHGFDYPKIEQEYLQAIVREGE